ncbi:TetR/AcrR family transcriptional regulator [Butyrivibrio sp. MC2013]|uniref:TetR/AcrR family transcriptional regulator n=1 Tax=Butyrivibrio sp. MC2013 TaxID=1280686 RepID=UPI000406CF5D|nr:TetR/AcrR family transcriptional regulator [Butyrivibrio sp. MC2013]
MKNSEKNNEEKILEATLRVMEAHTISGTRISLIAKEADMLQSNVLYYYKTKEEILIALQKKILGNFPKLREELREGAEDTLESALDIFTENEIHLIENFPEYNHAEMDFWVQSRVDEDTRQRFAESYSLWRQEIGQVLDRYVPGLPDDIRQYLPAQYVSMLEGATIQYLIDEDSIDLRQYFEMSKQIVLKMVEAYR